MSARILPLPDDISKESASTLGRVLDALVVGSPYPLAGPLRAPSLTFYLVGASLLSTRRRKSQRKQWWWKRKVNKRKTIKRKISQTLFEMIKRELQTGGTAVL